MLYICVRNETSLPLARLENEWQQRASLKLKNIIASSHKCTWKVGKNNRPVLSVPGLDFNISHHKQLCLAVTGPQVGIDVTYSCKCLDAPTFTREEMQMLFTVVPNTKLEFLIAWAAREAYLKYLGDGVSELPLNFENLQLSAQEITDIDIGISSCLIVEKNPCHVFTIQGCICAAVCPLEVLSHRQYISVD